MLILFIKKITGHRSTDKVRITGNYHRLTSLKLDKHDVMRTSVTHPDSWHTHSASVIIWHKVTFNHMIVVILAAGEIIIKIIALTKVATLALANKKLWHEEWVVLTIKPCSWNDSFSFIIPENVQLNTSCADC